MLPGSEKSDTAEGGSRYVSQRGGERRKMKRENLRVGSANVGSMNVRSGEIVDMVPRKKLDFCTLQ